MKVIVGIGIIGLLAGCARDDSSSRGSAPANEQGSAQHNTVNQPITSSTSTRMEAVVRTNAGPNTGVGAATTASGGVGPASASVSTALESDAALSKDRNPSPAGTGAQSPTVKSNNVGNTGSSTPPYPGSKL